MRIMATRQIHAEQETGVTNFLYRLPGSRDWRPLSRYNEVDRSGFYPEAIDHDRNVAYGYKRKDGRLALYSVTLDESLHEDVVYERPDVDVGGLVYIGRDNRPVLLFHGELDANVNIQQSKSMAARLKSVGGTCELVTWDDLDHQLEDSDARTQMLRKSDEFLRKAMRM